MFYNLLRLSDVCCTWEGRRTKRTERTAFDFYHSCLFVFFVKFVVKRRRFTELIQKAKAVILKARYVLQPAYACPMYAVPGKADEPNERNELLLISITHIYSFTSLNSL